MSKYIITGLFIIGLIAGFLAGRLTISIKETVKYVKSETVNGSVSQARLKPDTVYIPLPGEPIFVPMKADTVRLPGEVKYIVSHAPDTAAVFNDYIARKDYNMNLIDDKETGKIDVSLSLQYNALRSFDYTYTPVTKVVTRTKERVLQPFVSAGWSTAKHIGVGAGIFYHDLGLEYQYLKGYNGIENGHFLGVKLKF
jgi:hypothetical protein